MSEVAALAQFRMAARASQNTVHSEPLFDCIGDTLSEAGAFAVRPADADKVADAHYLLDAALMHAATRNCGAHSREIGGPEFEEAAVQATPTDSVGP
jgi:hypothetical protein